MNKIFQITRFISIISALFITQLALANACLAQYSNVQNEEGPVRSNVVTRSIKPIGVSDELFNKIIEIKKTYLNKQTRYEQMDNLFSSYLDNMTFVEFQFIIDNMDYFLPGALSIKTSKAVYSEKYFDEYIDLLSVTEALTLSNNLSYNYTFYNAAFNRAIEKYFDANVDKMSLSDRDQLISALRNTYIVLPIVGHEVKLNIPQNLTKFSYKKVQERLLDKWQKVRN